jgi:D-2-hydroxyglutarate dehydrogenase
MLGKVKAYDLSLDVKEWVDLVHHLRKTLKTDVMGYGHIGDGNIHVNIIVDGHQINDK